MNVALEMGAIPVIEEGEAHEIPFGDHPLPTVPFNDWGDISFLKNDYLDHPEELLRLQILTNSWWISWKEKLRSDLALLVEENLFK